MENGTRIFLTDLLAEVFLTKRYTGEWRNQFDDSQRYQIASTVRKRNVYDLHELRNSRQF